MTAVLESLIRSLIKAWENENAYELNSLMEELKERMTRPNRER